MDVATLSLKLDNSQMNAGVDATTGKLETMGAKGTAAASAVETAIRKQGVQMQQTHNITIAATRDMGTFDALNAEAAGHVGEHSLSVGRLEKSLAHLTEHVAGLNPQLALTIETLGHFAIGSVEMVAILGALAIMAYAWEKLTETQRKNREETERSIKALTDLQTKQRLGTNTTGDDATRVGIEMAKLKIDIEEEISKLAKMHTSADPHTRQRANDEDEVLGAMVLHYQELGRLMKAHDIQVGQEREQARITAIEAEKQETDRHNAIIFAAQDRERLAAHELAIAGADASNKERIKASYDAETERIQAQRKAIDDAFEDRIRLAKQAAQLVGLEGDGLRQVLAEQAAINAAVKARHDSEAEVTAQSIRTASALREQAAEVLKDVEESKLLKEEMKKAQAEIEKGFKDMFTRVFGHGKSVFQQLADELGIAFGQKLAMSMFSMYSVYQQTGVGGFTNANDIANASSSANKGLEGLGIAGAGLGIGGLIGSMTTNRAVGALGGAAGGAATGAAIGAMGGPVGIALGAMIGGAAGLVGGFLGAQHGAEAAKEALLAIEREQLQASATLANWRAQITGSAADQKAAALLNIHLQYMQIQAEIEKLEAGKRQEQQRNKDLADAATLYAQALGRAAGTVTGAFSNLVNMVQGYKLQATIFGAAPSWGPAGSAAPGGSSGDLHATFVFDGQVLGKSVIKDFARRRARGDNTLLAVLAPSS